MSAVMRNLMICLLALSAHPGVHAQSVLLLAEFDEQPLNMPIGVGGPELGQPISVHPDLSAVVVDNGLPSPALRLSQTVTGTTKSARFELLGGVEITTGELSLRFAVRAQSLERFLVRVREQGSSTASFSSLTFTETGTVALGDTGPAIFVANYVPGQYYRFELRHHLAQGTYDLYVDGVRVVQDRAHGVTGQGIGALLVSTDVATAANWFVDDIRVIHNDVVFRDQFEDS